MAAIDVIQKLGAVVTKLENGDLHIVSGGVNPASNTINCGESGLGIRMFTPIAALSDNPITIMGMGSLTTRPMHFFDEILPQVGVSLLLMLVNYLYKYKGLLSLKILRLMDHSVLNF